MSFTCWYPPYDALDGKDPWHDMAMEQLMQVDAEEAIIKAIAADDPHLEIDKDPDWVDDPKAWPIYETVGDVNPRFPLTLIPTRSSVQTRNITYRLRWRGGTIIRTEQESRKVTQ